MAHRIAELMTAAEAADAAESPEDTERIRRTCMDTILALWQHRSAWPQGWPPPAAKRLIDLLADVYAPGGLWAAGSTVLGQLQALHHDMLGTIVDVLGGSPDTYIEERWLETFGGELDPAERETLEYVTSAGARLQRRMTSNLDAAEGTTALAAHLRARAETYRALIENVAVRLEEVSGTEIQQPHPDEGSS
jgi:hypothetical protein